MNSTLLSITVYKESTKFSFFTNFRNTNWKIFVDFVIKIFIFTNFYY